MNPYELIYSPYQKSMNTSQYKPISRSFFKLLEIDNMLNLIGEKDNYFITNFFNNYS